MRVSLALWLLNDKLGFSNPSSGFKRNEFGNKIVNVHNLVILDYKSQFKTRLKKHCLQLKELNTSKNQPSI